MSGPVIPKVLQDHPRIDQWIAFEDEGKVRVRSGRVELGQGVASAMVQIAADELDVAPETIHLISGDTREVPDEGTTSGSRSIEVGGMSVRLAASAARSLLLEQAAQLLQAQPEELSVVEGLVHVKDRPTDLTYWTLAPSVDLGQTVADHAHPKTAAQRHLVGTVLKRRDLLEKVMGGAYVQDLTLPGMLHGRVLHPASIATKVAEFEAGDIEGLPGVVQVVRDGSFLGVIAEREEDALNALARMERRTKWTSGADAPEVPIEAIKATETEPAVQILEGDPDAVEGRRFSGTFTRPYIAHGSIGTCCALALWEDDTLLVYSHTQGAFQLRDALAIVLDVPKETVNVVHVPGAGCYGHNGADDVALDAALLARATPGRPVRVVWSRSDELGAAPLGSGMAIRLDAVVDGSNRIVAYTADVASQPHGQRPSGSNPGGLLSSLHLEKPFPRPPVGDVPLAGGGGADRNVCPSYAIPNVRVAKRIIGDLPFRTSSLRALGGFTNVFAVESFIDDIAYEIGADPLQFRLDHLEDERAREVLERVARAAGWPGPEGEGTGLGLAFARYKLKAAYCAVAAKVEVEEDVRVLQVWTAVDAGEIINPDGIANQIEGGVIQATSWTLKEAIGFDGDAVETRDWETYPILTFAEVPPVEVEIVSRPEDPTLGVGEASMGPTAGAIGNAVRRALGVRVRDLPLSRDAIIAALS